MSDDRPVVLDASALLAFLRRETGANAVKEVLSRAIISSVNWSEVAQKSLQHGRAAGPLRADLVELGLNVMPFTVEDAEIAAAMYQSTRSLGLSLGDRSCLALAQRLTAPALTVDRRWADTDTGVEVRVIR